ncbi:MAG: hypothetical protein N2038_04890 [Geminicoccaceae bacterium]|nr:hypothetical protein [Geminicoccaceae bacterium]MCS7268895.1 hypothetical protein [Geminicoccaceae bacterium]MCX7629570.1 hypothetical protein [Geminicoccaceae bacterium]MDW8342001.1 hypothetical protein [Geminicoccaceae bacterium]
MTAALARDAHALATPRPEAPRPSPPSAADAAAPGGDARLPAHDDREPGPALAALLALASPAEREQLLALRRDWLARHKPIDRAERLAVEAVVAVLWRLEALAAVEARVLAALRAGERDRRLPGPATLARLRRELCAERERAERDLEWLRKNRPRPYPSPWLAPARLEWLAEKLREGAILVPARGGEAQKGGAGEAPVAAAGPTAAAPEGEAAGPREGREKAAPEPPFARSSVTKADPRGRPSGPDDGLARLARLLFGDPPLSFAAPPRAGSARPAAVGT